MKKVLGMVMATAVTVALTGCSGFDDESVTQAAATASRVDNARSRDASARGVIYGIHKVGDQTQFIDEGEVTRKVVEQRGNEFTYVDVKVNPEEYLKVIDNAVANQVKGVVTCIPDQTMSQVVVDKCKETGVPVVVYDDALQNDTGDRLAPRVGIDAYAIGQTNGDWLTAHAKDNNLVEDEQCGLLFLTMDAVSSCVPRAEEEYDDFTANCPDFPAEHIFRADYDGTMDRGSVTITSVITAHPETKKWLIAGANEEETTGAVRALESAGLDGNVCIVGLGAYMVKDEWNGKGAEGTCMRAATYFSPGSVGKGSVKVPYEVIGGKEVSLETAVDAIVAAPESYREVMGKVAK